MDLPFKFVTLWTDVVLWVMLLGLGLYVRQVRRDAALRATWRRVFVTPSAMASAVLLGLMLLMTLADSVHFRRALPDVAGGVRAFDTRTESVLDIGLTKLIASRENSYSQPLATYGFSKEAVPPQPDAKPVLDEHGVPTLPARAYPRLRHGGAGLADAERDWAGDIAVRLAWGTLAGAAVSLLLWLLVRPARATSTTTTQTLGMACCLDHGFGDGRAGGLGRGAQLGAGLPRLWHRPHWQ
jgi:peptide/nickel transport system permease protein